MNTTETQLLNESQERQGQLYPPEGGTFGRYTQLCQIGAGGNGRVYRAWDAELERWVALKTIHPEMMATPSLLERFRREVRIHARLSIPGVVRLYDGGREGVWPYYTMEFINGQPLTELLDDPAHPLAQRQTLLLQVVRILAGLHEQQVCHRDVKPANILLRADGHSVLVDFGIAKVFGPEALPDMTLAGFRPGTTRYLSPDRPADLHHEPRAVMAADVYAVGLVGYELLTFGHFPYTLRADYVDALHDIRTLTPMALQHWNAQLDPALCQVVMAMLAKDWRQRLTADEAASRLAAILREESPKHARPTALTTTEPLPSPPSPPPVALPSPPSPPAAAAARPASGAAGSALPADLLAVKDADYAPLARLAPGSKEAQQQQRTVVERLGLPLEVVTAKIGIAFRLLPAGTFIMGSPPGEAHRGHDETPHLVTQTKPFYCGMYPVTQGQWAAVMGHNPSSFTVAGTRAPVESVSWLDCQEFINQLCLLEGVAAGTYRLLTEAEWEYACRAGTGTPFCYGDSLAANQANFDGTHPYGGAPKGPQRATTIPVGQFAANAWGLYDLHGNVWEWCQDWYGAYPAVATCDPTGPTEGTDRVTRGGSWYLDAWLCRSALRVRYAPETRRIILGFRLARAIPATGPAIPVPQHRRASIAVADTRSDPVAAAAARTRHHHP